MMAGCRRSTHTTWSLFFAIGTLFWLQVVPLAAQTTAADPQTSVPFQIGERAVFRVGWGIFGNVGTATLAVAALDTVRGDPAYRLVYTLRAGIPGARVNDRTDSWMHRSRLFCMRFQLIVRQPGFERDRTREFFPEQKRWTGMTNDTTREESGILPSDLPLDDISFLFYVRTMQLEVGKEYTLDRYWDPKGNPVRLKVLRRETVKVPAGTFSTIVVQPIIKTDGLFSEGGRAEVYFSDGPRRQPVLLRVKLSVGTLRLQLESYRAAES